MTEQPAERSDTSAYRVLARKYRPARFADLIGQEALVRTLHNAIAGGRLAHAFMLTGVRGVGKTTTARIIARALNCVGPDGTGSSDTEPCGVCEHCVAIAEDRHMDVLEMDAASRTGIDDIRELIEGVRYRPVSARYKVYIIDEVHMLSRQAFNGLLKTLEEPPEHVVFIFATTEIRKVPITVLSRCQRFDLRRVSQEDLGAHFAALAEREGIEASPEALAMIARAADGSVRDGLSLLDQAIAMAGASAGGDQAIKIEAALVQDMLGLADRAQILDIFEAVMAGDTVQALTLLEGLYDAGADPAVVLQDLLELTHFITRIKLLPAAADAPGTPEDERRRGAGLAKTLDMPVLARTWQILLKGLGETQRAPSPIQAAEMVLIRLCYAAELPSPGDLVKRLADSSAGPAPSVSAPSTEGNGGSVSAVAGSSGTPTTAPAPGPQAQLAQPLGQAEPDPDLVRKTETEVEFEAVPQSFEDVIALLDSHREYKLAKHLVEDVHLVAFEPGRVEFRPDERAPRELPGELGRLLKAWTSQRWVVAVSSEPGQPTLGSQRRAQDEELRAALMQDPLVQAALDTFPGARLVAHRARDIGADPAESDVTENNPSDEVGGQANEEDDGLS